jgi:hypothetical protein
VRRGEVTHLHERWWWNAIWQQGGMIGGAVEHETLHLIECGAEKGKKRGEWNGMGTNRGEMLF